MMTLEQTVRAAWLAGKGATAAEIAKEIGYESQDNIRRTLGMFRTPLANKIHGGRSVSVYLTKQQFDALDRAAAARGLVGSTRYEALLERLVRIVAGDIDLVDNLLDDEIKTDGARR